jgi:hypothetical protein
LHNIIDKWLEEANKRNDLALKKKLWKLSDYELMPGRREKIKPEVYGILDGMKQTKEVKEIREYFKLLEGQAELIEEEQGELFL